MVYFSELSISLKTLFDGVPDSPKALLLDMKAKSSISSVYSFQQLYESGIFFVDQMTSFMKYGIQSTGGRISENDDPSLTRADSLDYITCIIMFDPNVASSLVQATRIIQESTFKSFVLVLTGGSDTNKHQYHFERLARADLNRKIMRVFEIPLDFLAYNKCAFSTCKCSSSLIRQSTMIPWKTEDQETFDASFNSLMSVASIFFRKANSSSSAETLVFYSQASKSCRKFAEKLTKCFQKKNGKGNRLNIIFLFDRREDPVSPLLTPFTYQAQVMDLLPIENGIISSINDNNNRVSLSVFHDKFFEEHANDNFGDINERINQELQKHQQTQNQTNLLNKASVEDMKRFMELLPKTRNDYQKLKKHVDILHKICDIVDKKDLLKCAALEQSIASENDKKRHPEQLIEMIIQSSKNEHDDHHYLLKLLLLFTLKYEQDEELQKKVMAAIQNQQLKTLFNEAKTRMIDYAGHKIRHCDIFHNKSLIAMAKSKVKQISGSQNVFMKYESLILRQLKSLFNENSIWSDLNHISVAHCVGPSSPFSSESIKSETHDNLGDRIRESECHILVYCLGGVTPYEISEIDTLNTQFDKSEKNNKRILIGSPKIITSKTFLEDLYGMKDELHSSSKQEINLSANQINDNLHHQHNLYEEEDEWNAPILGKLGTRTSKT